jgi:hypothetical protein
VIAPFAGNLVPTLAPGKEHRQLIRARKLPELIAREAGIVFSPVEHEDNVQFSDDEVAQIREIVGELIGQNRLNVALSRARILAVVVGDPRIASTPCHMIDSMRPVNLYCRLGQEHW